MQPINRRTLLQGMAVLALPGCASQQMQTSQEKKRQIDYAWRQAEQIAKQTPKPTFPNKQFDIRDFGAQANSPVSSSEAINKAIQACHSAGGGKVLVTAGSYQSGPIHLLSNVNLHITANARIRFSTSPKHYLPAVFTRWEGVEFMGYSPLIYAYKQHNIAITGEGTLDGQADASHWWSWKGGKKWGVEGHPTQAEGRAKLFADAEAGVPPEQRHYSEGFYFRPPFIQPYRCTNVLIEGVKVIRSPFWLLNPVLCENVHIRQVHLESLGPNSDGCDPESCKNVVIDNCYFDTGDDCIAIKSGRNNDGRRVATPSENIVIRNCKMRAGHGGVVIGSEISGGVRNVFAENNEMSSPDLERGIRIKTNSVRGGLLENIYIRQCRIGEVQDAIVINFHYEEGDAGEFDPIVRNVVIENLECAHAKRAFQVRGFKRAPIEQMTVLNTHFVKADDPGIIENVAGLKLEGVFMNGVAFNL